MTILSMAEDGIMSWFAYDPNGELMKVHKCDRYGEVYRAIVRSIHEQCRPSTCLTLAARS
jgi:hypothetical protein